MRFSSEVGVQPSSETGPHLRRRPALERGGTSPEGAASPRARRGLTRGGDQPSSEAKVCQCGAWAVCLVGRWGRRGRGPVSLSCVCFRFVCVFVFAKVSGLSLVV
jgi:hypothetical protein